MLRIVNQNFDLIVARTTSIWSICSCMFFYQFNPELSNILFNNSLFFNLLYMYYTILLLLSHCRGYEMFFKSFWLFTFITCIVLRVKNRFNCNVHCTVHTNNHLLLNMYNPQCTSQKRVMIKYVERPPPPICTYICTYILVLRSGFDFEYTRHNND